MRQAVSVAKASAQLKYKDVVLDDTPPVTNGYYKTPVKEDPFKVPVEDKLELLLTADARMREVEGVKVTQGSLNFYKERKIFASTEGAWIEQEIVHSGGGIRAKAVKGEDVQVRSYPNSFEGDYAAEGFEFIRKMNLPEEAPRVASEAVALLSAKQCPQLETDLILAGDQLALQIHESCGHPTELDRVLGTEVSYAGTSFLTLDKLNNFYYGSPQVTITADATLVGGLGSFGYDDEGVPAQRSFLVKEGKFVGYQTSRETAPIIGERSNGCMRADGWNRLPLIRMTNINLEPGDWTLDEMIEDTKEGIYMETNRSWSIDDLRLNFQFGTEVAYEIKDGSLGELYKNPTYTGITPQFWNSCDAIANRDNWKIWGLVNCGKGEPSQSMRVAHGASAARFKNVKIGIWK